MAERQQINGITQLHLHGGLRDVLAMIILLVPEDLAYWWPDPLYTHTEPTTSYKEAITVLSTVRKQENCF